MSNFIIYGVLIACLLNLLRMSLYMVSSDVYTIKNAIRSKRRKRWHLTTVSVMIPAYNEENTIERALLSLYESDYPPSKFEVIVVNDGSTDNTRKVIENFKKTHKDHCKFRLINRPNKGKAAALNYALRRCAKGRLIMCLDADSYLDPKALRNSAQYFKDRNLLALSSNVNIVEDGRVLALIQRFEYIASYQMKKGRAWLGLDYIIGGLGSTFRRSAMKKVSFYDTNTMTEDIDLTMKIIVNKAKKQKIAYASNSIVYTEAVHSLHELIKQRYRWKFGQNQTFYKHSRLFFSNDKNHSKRLSWFMLPYALFQDMLYFFEPLVIVWFLYIILRYGEVVAFTSAFIILTLYLLFNIWASDNIKTLQKLRLTYYAPPMYLLMYALSFAEYFALIKSLLLLPKLKGSLSARHITWKSPKRNIKTASA